MQKGIMVLIVALLTAALAFCVYPYFATRPVQTRVAMPEAGMEWLRREFQLTDTQFERIKAMHETYAPKCDHMCQRIAEANEKLGQVVAANKTVTADVQAALKESAAVQAECREALLGHTYSVSAEMSRESGARYLKMMQERIIQPGMRPNPVVSEPPR